MSKKGKKYTEAVKKVDSSKLYTVNEAVALLKELSFEKFDATVELAFRLNLDPRKAEQNLRGAFVLPNGSGKTKKVLVFAKGDKAKEAEAAGADYVGEADYVEKIMKGWFEFDTVVATPDMMAVIGKLGRILGPRGLMPNPKTGTVTNDVTKAVADVKAGKVEYRVDKAGNIQLGVGKVSFDNEKLAQNIQATIELISKLKPSTVKGTFVKNITVSTTMGPGIRVLAQL
ncbi:MAG: 50S ribosomal protein L1 [Gammaproteobacteria bacterium]|nr:50S ribosomal protein L1 [Gammaproteobacteria bacterium]